LEASAAEKSPETRVPRLFYVPGLDGLRALAVTSVLFYHAGMAWMPGGFLGVEVFFVLSGYLITSLLLAEWQHRGSINLGAFWLRRARRLLPALFLLLIVVSLYAILFLPDEVARLRGDALVASGYVTNWYLAFSQQSYFEFVGRPSLLQHLWSLAVEEQFYLLWPLLFVSGMLILKTRRGMMLAALAGAVASVSLMAILYQPDVDPSRIYYGTDTRAAGLLIGCALAFVYSLSRSPARRSGRILAPWVDLLGFAGLGTLIYILRYLDETQSFLYQGGFAAVSITTATAIWAVVNPNARLFSGLLGWQPLRWIGMRSYGIYLWHWPIFDVTRPQLDTTLDGIPLLALRFGLTLALAELSYRFVETPIREGWLGRFWGSLQVAKGGQRYRLGAKLAVASIVSGMLIGALGTAMVSARPPATPDYLLELDVNATALAEETAEIPIPVDTEVATSTATPTLFIENPQPSPTTEAVSTEQPSAPNTSTPTPTLVSADPHVSHTPTVSTTAAEQATQTPTNPPAATETATVTVSAGKPTASATPAKYNGHVVAIGDSVMLSAAKVLRKSIPDIDIDAVVNRQASTLPGILKARRDAGTLGDTVVIHIGNNGTFSTKHFDQVMQVLADVPKVVFLTVKVPRVWERTNNIVIAEGVQRYPNAVLLDWREASNGHAELFAKDGIHLQTAGARLYTDLLVATLSK
jgi:peptidoglycan/LPS O-acetylase OafA/YrhL